MLCAEDNRAVGTVLILHIPKDRLWQNKLADIIIIQNAGHKEMARGGRGRDVG